MKFYTQKVDGNIGNTKWTVRSYGCLGTCFGMILEVDPRQIFKHAEYFNSDGLLTNPQKLCNDFGGEWNSSRSDIGLRPVIVETKFDGLMHFVVWDGNRFYDPLSANGNPLRGYKIISFRNVKLHPKKNATKGDEMIPENLLPGRLERDPDGKVWWWTENGDWFHNRMDLCVQRPDYKQIIKDLENRPPVEKIVEKPVDRPETLIELKKAQETIVELKKTISDNTKTHATELTTCETIKDDLILQKSDWIKEMADYDKKYYLIPRDTFKKWITHIVELIKKVYNLRKDKK